MFMDMYIITPALVCIVHIGVSVIVYSWSGVLLEPSVSRISVNNVRAFLVYMYNDNINHLKVAPVTNLG